MKKIALLLLAFVSLISLFSRDIQKSDGTETVTPDSTQEIDDTKAVTPDSTQENDITIPDYLSEYLTYVNGEQYLILPMSKNDVRFYCKFGLILIIIFFKYIKALLCRVLCFKGRENYHEKLQIR